MPLPRPVYRADTALAELGTAELFVLALTRLWTAAHREPQRTMADWRGGFTAVGIDAEGGESFDYLLQILAAGARRTLDVRQPHCCQLGRDEAWLLRIISLMQHRGCAEGELILAYWLAPAPARVAALHAQRFANALATAELVIPLRHRDAAAPRPPTTTCRDRGLLLVH
jgi:hypothetical protein